MSPLALRFPPRIETCKKKRKEKKRKVIKGNYLFIFEGIHVERGGEEEVKKGEVERDHLFPSE